MNSNAEPGVGGALIKPSARRSIHSHRGICPFSPEGDMGRYGVSPSKQKNSKPADTDQERDEVDNILSKPAYNLSHPTNINGHKRNSFDFSNSSYADDSDVNNVLAKSLPATLPSYSSDEFSSWPLQQRQLIEHQKLQNIIQDSTASDFDVSNYESIPSTPDRNFNYSHQARDQQFKTQQPVILYLGVITLIVSFLIYHFNFSNKMLDAMPDIFGSYQYNVVKFYNDLNNVGERYKINEDSILQLKTGIATIFNRQDTGSFVFAYQSNKNSFNAHKFNDFINTVASTAAKYLRNDTIAVQHIVVDGSKLKMQSHSELINKYKDDVTKTGVMLITDLDAVPSALAMAFHYYCDEYNPLVKKSAIFFTLDMTKCSGDPVEQTPTHSHIEKCLQKKWSEIPKDNINPLLNRVVNTVVDVTGD